MIRALVSRSAFSVCLVAGVVLPACGGVDAEPASRARTGTLAMPLTTTVNDHTYRLNASLFVSGPTVAFLSTSVDPNETALRALLTTGSYSASLNGWTLERQREDGSFAPVQAMLASSSWVNFSIENGTTTTISFAFQTDGVVVTIGQGNLLVRVAVSEVAPLCTPLGSECGEGSWCPPPGLTGAPIACVPAGLVAIGEPCIAPGDCVANASCIELDGGPACAALCPSSASGEDCETGGTCQPAGTDYGVCR